MVETSLLPSKTIFLGHDCVCISIYGGIETNQQCSLSVFVLCVFIWVKIIPKRQSKIHPTVIDFCQTTSAWNLCKKYGTSKCDLSSSIRIFISDLLQCKSSIQVDTICK